MQSMMVRLRGCKDKAEMTVSDLAAWFDRPRSTVATWVELGREPFGPPGRLAFRRLDMLELAIRKNKGLPVPSAISWAERARYIRGVRDAVERNTRVPEVRTAV